VATTNRDSTLTPPYVLGFDIGGTKTALVLGTLDAQIVRRAELPTPVTEPFERAFEVIGTFAQRFLESCQADGLPAPQAIGVAVGGPLDIERGILFAPPHLKQWGQAPLKQRLEEWFGLPVFVEHDGNAGALAEFYFGAGRGVCNLIFLTMGTGLGAGIIVDGAIYHGSTDAAGEVGHIRLAEDGPVEYGKAGSWEAFCSGAGIVKLARWRSPEVWDPEVTTQQIVSQALAGDPPALELIEEVGRWLGKGLALLVDVFNPDLIVLGTLGVVLGDLLLEPARKIVQQEALPRSAAACHVVPAQLGSALGDVGCLAPALEAYRRGRLVFAARHSPRK
jgi:glucokinase